ncbi:hypothetical protein G5I_05323 [Acromyrmex echinatior]|uniref:Uncharacterized protein n=1 Tax=Acromyrmex echinatior TaxID=103372 RepID=F4WHX6_ACREC|nr:hypothetical protein G5I_05323 [Acromyrmex echinatior]
MIPSTTHSGHQRQFNDRSRGVGDGDGVRGWRGQWRSELMATVGAQPRKIDAKDSPSSADNRTPPRPMRQRARPAFAEIPLYSVHTCFLDNFESSYVSLECVRAYTPNEPNYPGHKLKRATLGEFEMDGVCVRDLVMRDPLKDMESSLLKRNATRIEVEIEIETI